MKTRTCVSALLPACSRNCSNNSRAGVSASAARIGKSLHFFSLFLVLCLLAEGTGALKIVEVSNCVQLQEELGKENGAREISVVAPFVCEREDWDSPLLVTRNVTVRGGRGTEFPAIDWTGLNKVLAVRDNIHVTFRHLVFLQDEMGVGGINMGFFATLPSAWGTFSGVVVGVRSCPESFKPSKTVFQQISRPEWMPGRQVSDVRSANTLHISDIGLEWNQSKAVWRFCNIFFECGVGTLQDPRLKLLFQDPVIQGREICPVHNDKDNGDDRRRFTSRVAVIAGSCAASLLVVLLLAMITWQFFWRKKVGERCAKEDQKSGMDETDVTDTLGDSHLYHVDPPASNNWKIKLSEVTLGTPLGHGSFARVFKGSWQGTTVAVKIIHHSDRLLQTNSGEPFEAFLSQQISHPNVIQTYHVSCKEKSSGSSDKKTDSDYEREGDGLPNNDFFPSLDKEEGLEQTWAVGSVQYETWVVLEYCDMGSLQQALAGGSYAIGNAGELSKLPNVLQTALEIASAMNYLHSFRIIHGDLKPGNVLLKSDGSMPRGFICKVGDFGLSRVLDDNSHIDTFTYGTVTHMPPELLRKGVLSPAADVYSFGILLWELVTGELPFAGKNPQEIIMGVVDVDDRPKLPSFIPEEYTSLATDCWEADHELRPDFPAIIDRLRRMLMRYGDYQNPESNMESNALPAPTVDLPGWNSPSVISSASGGLEGTQQLCDTSVMKSTYTEQIDGYGQINSIDTASRASMGHRGFRQFSASMQETSGGFHTPPPRFPVSADHVRSSTNKNYWLRTATNSGNVRRLPISEDLHKICMPQLPTFTTVDTMFLSDSEEVSPEIDLMH